MFSDTTSDELKEQVGNDIKEAEAKKEQRINEATAQVARFNALAK